MKILMILAVLNLPFFKYIINNQTLFFNSVNLKCNHFAGSP